jgi:hypothetical protein
MFRRKFIMSVISQYEVSPSSPSTVIGVPIGALKFFSSGPTPNLWNPTGPGVNQRADSTQVGNTPSATSALGQLSLRIADGKPVGGRFRIYASGSASSATTPTILPQVQINTGPVSSPNYVTLLQPALTSGALVAGKPISWSVAGDLFYDPNNGTLHGFSKYTYAAVSGGTAQSQGVEAAITAVNNLFLSGGLAGSGVGTAGQPGFGFVVGITFNNFSDVSNSASLYEFKIIQD